MIALPQIRPSYDSAYSIPLQSVDTPVPSSVSALLEIVGGLTATTKMPGPSYSISAFRCNVGGRLRSVEGSTCSRCYACKGNYTRFPSVQAALERRYRSLSDPRWTAAMAAIIQRRGYRWFRWHDSGDLQSANHLANIVSVARACPETSFWLPTREYGLIDAAGEFPANLRVRVSAHLQDRAAPARFSHTSRVASHSGSAALDGAWACPAPSQGGRCGECRACWSSAVPAVVYHVH